MHNPLKLYVNKRLCDEHLSYSPLLFPFWPRKIKKRTPLLNAVWERYNFDPTYYGFVDNVEEADYLFLPHNYWLLQRRHPQRLSELLTDARRYRKPILIDAYGDSDAEIPIERAVILRTSQYRFKKKPHEIILPAYVEDLQEAYVTAIPIAPRPKSSTPVIGFAGWAEVSRKATVKALLWKLIGTLKPEYRNFAPGVVIRNEMLTALSLSPRLKTHFLLRKAYSGHTATIDGNLQALRTEFISNILESDYTLNVKGGGNYSQRFYETLSLGRIPLFIDTACILPLESRINYQECCFFIDYTKAAHIDERVAEFHAKLRSEDFLRMQQRARAIFETYLRVDKFTKYLVEELFKQLSNYKNDI